MLTLERVLDDKRNQVLAEKGMDLVSDFYSKLENLGIDLTELKPILESNARSQLVVSGAGSGKTTLLILKLIRMFLGGQLEKEIRTQNGISRVPCSVLVCTFLRSGAEDLKRSLRRWLFKLGVDGFPVDAVEFSTIHARAKRDISIMGASFTLATNPEKYVERVARKLGITNKQGYAVSYNEIRDLVGVIMYYRNYLDSRRYSNVLASEYNLYGVELDNFVAQYMKELEADNALDFESIQEQLLYWGEKNPAVGKFLSDKYDFVFIDEFQDTSQLQYEMLKMYFSKARGVLAIGDDDQCIYSFRGSDVDIILKRFTEDTGAVVSYLTVNHRCARNIVEASERSVSLNKGRFSKKLSSSKGDGAVRFISLSEHSSFVKSVLDDLGCGRSVGIIGRLNDDLIKPAILLALEGVSEFTMSSRLSIASGIPKLVFSAISLLKDRYNDSFSRLLGLFARGGKRTATSLCEMLQSSHELSLKTLDEDAVETLSRLDAGLGNLVRVIQSGGTDYERVESLMFALSDIDQYSLYTRKVASFADFTLKLLVSRAELKDMSISELWFYFNVVIPEALSGVSQDSSSSLRISSVHDAKGKEWDSVYIYDDSDGKFPYEGGRRSLTLDELEEERRIHYVACTRARGSLTFIVDNVPSRFLDECKFTPLSREELESKCVDNKKSDIEGDLKLSINADGLPLGRAVMQMSDDQYDIYTEFLHYYSESNALIVWRESGYDLDKFYQSILDLLNIS